MNLFSCNMSSFELPNLARLSIRPTPRRKQICAFVATQEVVVAQCIVDDADFVVSTAIDTARKRLKNMAAAAMLYGRVDVAMIVDAGVLMSRNNVDDGLVVQTAILHLTLHHATRASTSVVLKDTNVDLKVVVDSLIPVIQELATLAPPLRQSDSPTNDAVRALLDVQALSVVAAIRATVTCVAREFESPLLDAYFATLLTFAEIVALDTLVSNFGVTPEIQVLAAGVAYASVRPQGTPPNWLRLVAERVFLLALDNYSLADKILNTSPDNAMPSKHKRNTALVIFAKSCFGYAKTNWAFLMLELAATETNITTFVVAELLEDQLNSSSTNLMLRIKRDAAAVGPRILFRDTWNESVL